MAYGDIGAVQDTEEYDPASGIYTTILKVGPGVVAIWYYNSGLADGIVSTYPISAAGVIGAQIDTWTFSGTLYVGSDWDISAVHVDGDVYATAYRGTGNILFVMTMHIATNGVITHAAIATVTFPGFPIGANFASFCKKTGTQTYLATWNTNPGGRVAAIHINDDGTGIASPDNWAFDATNAGDFSVIRYHRDDIFIVVSGSVGASRIRTFSVTDAGVITHAFIDNQLIDGVVGNRGNHARVNGDLWAVFYEDTNSDGKVASFTVDGVGNISAILAAFLYQTHLGDMLRPKSVLVGKAAGFNYLLVIGNHGALDAWAYTVRMDDNGLNITTRDSLRFVINISGGVAYPIYMEGDIYVLPWQQSPGAHGWIDTLNIETPPTNPMGSPLAPELVASAFI